MTSPLHDPVLEELLDRLHAQSDEQGGEMSAFFAEQWRENGQDLSQRGFDDNMRQFLGDKLVRARSRQGNVLLPALSCSRCSSCRRSRDFPRCVHPLSGRRRPGQRS